MAALMLLLSAVAVSCDDSTDTIGGSLTDDTDKVQIVTDTFKVSTRSIKADSVYARTSTGCLGRLQDPETGAFVTGNFTTTFHVLDGVKIWPVDSLYTYHETGIIEADSCDLKLYVPSFEGDSLATMKVTLIELDHPLPEDKKLYSNFDPVKEGYARTDANALKNSKIFTILDYTTPANRRSEPLIRNIRITLNEPYTDKQGKTYNNYGTYLLRMFYEHPEYFKNSQIFAKNVCPGFYLQMESGVGCMAYINATSLSTYFRLISINGTEKIESCSSLVFSGTEEVFQLTTITNDSKMTDLVADNSCTYLKTPAGIFTEMTLPVDEIMDSHATDTLNSAKIQLSRINDKSDREFPLNSPKNLLMIQKDSLYSFFEKGQMPNSRESYITSLNNNNYTFSNISNLIRHMYNLKKSGKASKDWNKVVLVPVSITTRTINNTTNMVSVNHDLNTTSTRLVGGSENPYDEVKISIIYSKFSGK